MIKRGLSGSLVLHANTVKITIKNIAKFNIRKPTFLKNAGFPSGNDKYTYF